MSCIIAKSVTIAPQVIASPAQPSLNSAYENRMRYRSCATPLSTAAKRQPATSRRYVIVKNIETSEQIANAISIGDAIDQICEEQVKCEERAGEEEIVDRVQVDLTQRGDDQHHEEIEQQGDRRPERDALRQRAGLQRKGERHADPVARHERRIVPLQPPAVADGFFFYREQRFGREVDGAEVRGHRQRKIVERLDAVTEAVLPRIHAARHVADVDRRLAAPGRG